MTHADKGWPWGVQGILESLFSAQARADVEAYLKYTQRICAEPVAIGMVCILSGCLSSAISIATLAVANGSHRGKSDALMLLVDAYSVYEPVMRCV